MTNFFMLLLFLLEISQVFRFHWIMKQLCLFGVSNVQLPNTRKRNGKKL